MADITPTSDSRSFLNRIVSKHLIVSFSLKFLTLCAHLLLLGDDAQALGTIKGCVDDLCLEWEALDLGHVDFFHLEQHVQRLEPVLERKDTVDGHVAELASEKRLVLRKVLGELVTELETLVQSDLGLNLGRDNGLGEHAGEVLGESGRIDSFDVTTCKIGKLAEGIDVALVALDRDDVDGHTSLLRDLTDLCVEAVSLLLVLLGHDLVEGTQADVGQAVRADDDARTCCALGGHRDRG